MFAGDAELLEAKGSGDEKILDVADLRLELRHVRLHALPHPPEELRDPHLRCEKSRERDETLAEP